VRYRRATLPPLSSGCRRQLGDSFQVGWPGSSDGHRRCGNFRKCVAGIGRQQCSSARGVSGSPARTSRRAPNRRWQSQCARLCTVKAEAPDRCPRDRCCTSLLPGCRGDGSSVDGGPRRVRATSFTSFFAAAVAGGPKVGLPLQPMRRSSWWRTLFQCATRSCAVPFAVDCSFTASARPAGF